MSIKGIVLAVVSVLAGATLIAFGGYRAGLHSAHKKLEKQKHQYEEKIEQLKTDYDNERNEHKSWQEKYCKLAKLKMREGLSNEILEANRLVLKLKNQREESDLVEKIIQLVEQLKPLKEALYKLDLKSSNE